MKKKLFVFDMDDTLITNNKWVDFNTFLGVSEEDDYRLYNAFKDEKITYAEWMDELERLYKLHKKSVTRQQVTKILQQVNLRDGARELIAAFRNKGYETAIITGSFVITAHTLADRLGIDHVVANTSCVFDKNDRLTGIHSRGTEGTMKNTYLLELCSALDINPHEDCYVIGDSIYDQPMFITTGKGITFDNATKELQESALHVVHDFSGIHQLVIAISCLYVTASIDLLQSVMQL